MSDQVAAAFIAALASVTVALITSIVALAQLRRHGHRLDKIGADASATRYQVQNDHPTNLRHDLDRLVDRVDVGFAGVHRRLNDLDQSDNSLWLAISRLTRRSPQHAQPTDRD
ncbi:MAG TPA: hypothetical protein VFH70_07750 [Acidimicrobiales bacterium]|nr:hypothetical protein [Acidimicrobiales bacterium]